LGFREEDRLANHLSSWWYF